MGIEKSEEYIKKPVNLSAFSQYASSLESQELIPYNSPFFNIPDYSLTSISGSDKITPADAIISYSETFLPASTPEDKKLLFGNINMGFINSTVETIIIRLITADNKTILYKSVDLQTSFYENITFSVPLVLRYNQLPLTFLISNSYGAAFLDFDYSYSILFYLIEQ